MLRCDDMCILRYSLQALFLVSSLSSFGSLGYLSFANFQSDQIFKFGLLKEKNLIRRCDVRRFDDMCILRNSPQVLFLVSSLSSFGSLGYLSFANFRSEQMFGLLKEKNLIRRCDVLRCDDMCILRNSPQALFLVSSTSSSLNSF